MRHTIKNRSLILALVFFGILISYVDRGNLSIATPALMREFRLSTSAMGYLLSAFFWTYGLFQLPAGFVVDRLGIRRAYLTAFLLWSLSSAAIALSPNVQTIFGLRLLLGLAESVGPLASLAFIRLAYSEQERGLPVSIYIAGQTIGPACGALLGTTLIATAGWRVMFAATGLGALAWLPLWFYFAPRSDVQISSSDKPPTAALAIQWRGLLTGAPFWCMSGCVLLFSYYWYFLLTWIPTYLNLSRGFSLIAMGRVLALPLFTMAPVNIAVNWLADRAVANSGKAVPVRLRLTAAGFLGASAILLAPRVAGHGALLGLLVVSVCSFGVGSTNFWALVQSMSPGALAARVIAYFNTLSQVAGALAPIVTGYTLGPTKNFSLAIALAGGSVLLAAGLLLITRSSGILDLKKRFGAY